MPILYKVGPGFSGSFSRQTESPSYARFEVLQRTLNSDMVKNKYIGDNKK